MRTIIGARKTTTAGQQWLAEGLSIHNYARLCLAVRERPHELDTILRNQEEDAGTRILDVLNDVNFAQPLGFTTFFPAIESQKLVQIVSELRELHIDELKSEMLRLHQEKRSGLYGFPTDLFELTFPDFNPSPKEEVLITTAENCLGLALNLATKFDQSQFNLWFELPDNAGIMNFLFGDLTNVQLEQVSVRDFEGDFSGHEYVIAFPPFGVRLPRQVAAGIKRTMRSANDMKSASRAKLRTDADLFAHRMLTEKRGPSQCIILVPELFMYSHGSFKEIRDDLSQSNQIIRIVRLAEKVLEPYTNASLNLIQFANYPLSSEHRVELTKVEIAKPARMRRSSPYVISETRHIDSKTLADSEIWNLDSIFSGEVAIISPKVETMKLGDAIVDVFRGPSTESVERGAPSRIEKLRVVGLTEMKFDVTDVDAIEPTDVGLNTPPNRYLLKDGDIVLTCRGTVMKVSLIQMSGENAAISSNNVAVIRLDREKIDPYFLCGFLVTDVGREALSARQSGATQKVLSLPDLKTIDVPMIPITEQSKIAQNLRDANAWYRNEQERLDAEYRKRVEKLNQLMGIGSIN
jgi:hypothetical protein